MISRLLRYSFLFLLVLLAACSEWNTDSLGAHFVPANSQVRAFTHVVYVEYSAEDVRVWGPAVGEVEVQAESQRVIINNTQSDSLALFVYGYVDPHDPTNSSLTVKSTYPYALYLNGLILRSQSDAAIASLGTEDCHIVLGDKSQNKLIGGIQTAGRLILSGTGELSVESDGDCITASSLQCQYGVNVSLHSLQSNGITLSEGPMRSTLGSWCIDAHRHAIVCADTIHLLNGSYEGTALTGAYFSTPTLVCLPDLLTASALPNCVIDADIAHRYDSVRPLWQQQVDTLHLQADTTYQVFRFGAKAATREFTPHQALSAPHLLVSHKDILPTDTLLFVQKPNKTTTKK